MKEKELEALNLFYESSRQTVPSNTIYEGLLAAFIVITIKYLCLLIPNVFIWHNINEFIWPNMATAPHQCKALMLMRSSSLQTSNVISG